MTKTILITGASGTVGSAAGKYLCNQGYEVVGVSRGVDDTECYTRTANIDLLDEEDLERFEHVLEGVDAVFHLAWNVSAENFDTHEAWEGNIQMYDNVMQAAKNAGVPIFINGSSIHAGTGDINAYTVEGSLEKTPEPYKSSIDPDSEFDLRKDSPKDLLDPRSKNPDSPYGWSKIMSERSLKQAVENGDFRIGVSIRIGGVNAEDKETLEGEPYYSSLYWSHKDIGRTLENILTADIQNKKGYHQFYGVSDNEGRIFSIENDFIGR
jgi:nucleoside-diphosphate-sugar epimerase